MNIILFYTLTLHVIPIRYFYFLLLLATTITSPATVKKRIPKIIYGNKNKNQESLDHPKLHNKLRINAHNKIKNIFNI